MKVVHTSAFIANQLDEHAESTKLVLGGGGIITSLARTLGYGIQVDTLRVLYHLAALICSLAST